MVATQAPTLRPPLFIEAGTTALLHRQNNAATEHARNGGPAGQVDLAAMHALRLLRFLKGANKNPVLWDVHSPASFRASLRRLEQSPQQDKIIGLLLYRALGRGTLAAQNQAMQYLEQSIVPELRPIYELLLVKGELEIEPSWPLNREQNELLNKLRTRFETCEPKKRFAWLVEVTKVFQQCADYQALQGYVEASGAGRSRGEVQKTAPSAEPAGYTVIDAMLNGGSETHSRNMWVHVFYSGAAFMARFLPEIFDEASDLLLWMKEHVTDDSDAAIKVALVNRFIALNPTKDECADISRAIAIPEINLPGLLEYYGSLTKNWGDWINLFDVTISGQSDILKKALEVCCPEWTDWVRAFQNTENSQKRDLIITEICRLNLLNSMDKWNELFANKDQLAAEAYSQQAVTAFFLLRPSYEQAKVLIDKAPGRNENINYLISALMETGLVDSRERWLEICRNNGYSRRGAGSKASVGRIIALASDVKDLIGFLKHSFLNCDPALTAIIDEALARGLVNRYDDIKQLIEFVSTEKLYLAYLNAGATAEDLRAYIKTHGEPSSIGKIRREAMIVYLIFNSALNAYGKTPTRDRESKRRVQAHHAKRLAEITSDAATVLSSFLRLSPAEQVVFADIGRRLKYLYDDAGSGV